MQQPTELGWRSSAGRGAFPESALRFSAARLRQNGVVKKSWMRQLFPPRPTGPKTPPPACLSGINSTAMVDTRALAKGNAAPSSPVDPEQVNDSPVARVPTGPLTQGRH